MINFFERKPILTIIVVSFLLLLPNLNFLEVTIMEARNFITAREMLTDGNWVLTTMNGEARYEKPPLPTWLTAISSMIFGVKSLWGLRLPAALTVTLLSVFVYMLSRKLNHSKTTSLHNGLIALTSLYVIVIIFEAPWDIYTHAFMLIGIYGMLTLFRKNVWSWKAALYIVMGVSASVLSKGPISFYALLLPFLLSYGICYRKELSGKQWLRVLSMMVLGLGLGFSWYIYVRYVDPDTFNRIAEEETGNWTSFNVRPFYYYWSFFTQSGLWTIPAFISLLYPYLKTRVHNLKGYQFTLLWTLLGVLLLSVIPEKKSRYLMPVLIPLALNTGYYIDYLVRKFKELKDKRETIPVYFNFGLVGAVLALAPLAILIYLLSKGETLWWYSYPLVLPSLIAGFYLFKFLIRKELHKVLYTLIVTLIAIIPFWLSVQQYFKHNPMLYNFDDDIPLYSFELDCPEMWYFIGRKAPNFGTKETLKYPEETSFLFLDYVVDGHKRHKQYLKEYDLEILDTIDLNNPNQRRRNRKWMNVIKATKR